MLTSTPFIPYAKQEITAEDVEAVASALSSPIITRGEKVLEFERELAAYTGAKYAVAFNSGTAALMAAYHAADIGSNTRVLTTPNTFVSTVGSAMLRKATPVFIDIERATGNIDLEALLLNLSRKTSRGKTVIVPVHYAGIAVDVQAIDAAIDEMDAMIIEDAAHAIGSKYKDGTMVGSCAYSHMAIFSFHPAKTITTGEGGCVTTNDEALAIKLKTFRNNGIENASSGMSPPMPWESHIDFLSGNYHLTEFQAALGLSQLKRIDSFIAKRKHLLATYHKLLDGVKHVQLLQPQNPDFVAPHLCVAHIDFTSLKTTRERVMNALKEKGIGTQYHYIPIYRQNFFTKEAGDISEYFPEMERHFAEGLSLPLHVALSESDVERVVKALKSCLKL